MAYMTFRRPSVVLGIKKKIEYLEEENESLQNYETSVIFISRSFLRTDVELLLISPPSGIKELNR